MATSRYLFQSQVSSGTAMPRSWKRRRLYIRAMVPVYMGRANCPFSLELNSFISHST